MQLEPRLSTHPTRQLHALLATLLTTPAYTHRGSLALIYTVGALVYCYFLNANTVIYTNTQTQDLFIHVDGAYRLLSGQIPHRDFASGLGAGSYYLTALLEPFANSIYQAFLWNNTLLLLFFTVLAFYVALSRLTFALAVLLLLYLLPLLAVPSNIGDNGDICTFAMYYNRFGWCALLLTFLFFIPGYDDTKHQRWCDTAAISVILVFCFYTKITYFLAALVLLGSGLVFFPATLWRKAVGVALSSTFAVMSIELLQPGLTFAYLSDIAEMGKANGGVEFDLITAIRRNVVSIALVLLAYLLVYANPSLLPTGSIAKRFYLSLLFLLICIFLIENNSQHHGIPALFALSCAYIMVWIKRPAAHSGAPNSGQQNDEVRLYILYLLALLFTIPEFSERNASIERFYRFGKEAALTAYPFDTPATMSGLIIDEGTADLLISHTQRNDATLSINLPEYRQLLNIKRPRQEIYQSEYAYTLANGSAMLQGVISRYGKGPVLTMDFANPFSYLLNLPPATGDYLWFHDDKNISDQHHPLADKLFMNIMFIMEPKYAVNQASLNILDRLYRPYIEENYDVVAKNSLWVIWKKNNAKSKLDGWVP